VAPGAYVHLVPCIAGFVGGDHVAMILATGLDAYRGVALGVDVGTNTEIVLVKDGKMVCTSCASGPAFEGGQITHGMRAMAGAIDRVWVEDGEVRYRVIGGGEPRGFSGSALIDLLAALVRIGAADAGGRLRAGRVFRVGGVPFSQGDLRQLQLAKAAIRSGIEALLRETGTGPEEIEKVFLAGAFGMAIDPGARASGPAWPLSRPRSGGGRPPSPGRPGTSNSPPTPATRSSSSSAWACPNRGQGEPGRYPTRLSHRPQRLLSISAILRRKVLSSSFRREATEGSSSTNRLIFSHRSS